MGKNEATVKSQATFRPSDFVHLHNHTHHSVLDGLTKIPDLVRKTAEFGMEAVAVTDHGTMSGLIDFYTEGIDNSVKPILGMEAYVAARKRTDRNPSKDKARFHLTILAMNDVGYHNLMIISSKANLEGMYYKPRIDHDLLEEYGEGLIILSGCASSEVGEALRNANYEEAKRIASWYKSIFDDRYYLELQDHGHPDAPHTWDVQQTINTGLKRLASELKIPMVVTCDGHYLEHEHRDAHEILLCVGTGAFLSDEKRMSLKDFELHLTDPKDIIARWGDEFPEVITNTRAIADRCNVTIELGKILIPKYPVPEGETEKSYLDKLVYRGLAIRYLDKSKEEAEELTPEDVQPTLPMEITERLNMEFEVLDRMGYNGYFLIVQDFINWGKSRGIVFGPGRGSAAGSIIAYSLNITDLDPLKYDLLFERFLNPDRISMPDIDIDIQDTRRDEVIQYCSDKYGAHRVANIVTFGKMAARAAVRDVARVLQVPYGESDRLSKLIPPPVQGRHVPLAKSVVDDPDLKREYESNPTAKEVFDYAMTLEGTIRSHGVHAAGVVIAPDDIVNYVPLEMAQKGVVATQYPMNPVENLGLLKMDFLGLSNLTIINNALRIIKKVHGVDIDLSTLPLEDAKTYELLQRGDTTGVFQLESAGMKRYLRQLRPERFEDIIAMVALYRPGPMQFIESFIRRKHGEERIEYLHSGLETSLADTYGILIYQEQFMKISKDWCGFTGGQADTLRKAVGKKKIDLMKQVKPEFVEGAIKVGGATEAIANKFWDQLEEFANYSFNKSHAACYGLISFWTAYLKAHYPEAFMAALMTSDQGDTDRLAIEMTECRHMGIDVLLPDVNESFVEFAVVPDRKEIRFGLAAVKGVGVGAVEEIIRAREEGGRFSSVADFAKRVNATKVNKRVWDSLIRSGGFDELGNRSDLLFSLDDINAFSSRYQKEAESGQVDLFGELSDDDAARASLSIQPAPQKHIQREQLMWERELLGLYMSAHPLDSYDAFFSEQTATLSAVRPDVDGRKIVVGGLVSSVRVIMTKSDKKMAFLAIEDKTNEAEVIVFPSTFEEVGTQLEKDVVVKVEGKVSARDKEGNLTDEAKVIASTITIITDDDLESYRPTGKKMDQPKAQSVSSLAKVKVKRKPRKSAPEPAGTKPASTYERREPIMPKRLFLHIKEPDDTPTLLSLKEACSDHSGEDEVIMVLGASRDSAVRLPFRVDVNQSLLDRLVGVIGRECVAVKNEGI